MSIRALKTVLLGIMIVPLLTAGCYPKSAQVNDPTKLGPFATEAKTRGVEKPTSEGSLWVSHSGRSDLFRDFKAREINDVLTIRVNETTQAVASADASNSKSTQASAGFDKLFGLEKKINELPGMVSGTASGTFEGKGATTRATTLTTTLTARVIDVLPNGYLIVEGMREVRVNNENQAVYLSGVVRPEDISRDNVVASSAVAQMAVRVQGRGVVSQPLKPGWLYKILTGILPF